MAFEIPRTSLKIVFRGTIISFVFVLPPWISSFTLADAAAKWR